MKTSELIEALTETDSRPVVQTSPAVRLLAAAAVGAAVALVGLGLWLGFGSLGAASRQPWFWMKAGYGSAAALAGLAMMLPLSRPARRPGAVGVGIAASAIIAIWLLAVRSAMNSDAAAQPALWLGQTWMVCPWRIVALAAPIWLAVSLAMRRLAPTRLAAAGAAAGMMAGGLAAVVYGLYCRESAAPFVAVWYSLGIAACAGLGALAGTRLLRW